MEEQAVKNKIEQELLNPPATKKNHWIIILIAFIAIIFIGSIFILLLNSQKSIPTPPSSISPTQSPLTDETANWNTYRNEKLGYEFKYPDSLSVTERGDFGENYIIAVVTDMELEEGAVYPKLIYELVPSTFTQEGGDPAIYKGFILDVREIPEYQRVEKYTDEKLENGMYISRYEQSFESGGYKGVKLSATIRNKTYNKQMSFIADFEGSKKQYYKIFDQILSAFKFTDQSQSIDTSNWKTYRNEVFGFEMRYPPNYEVANNDPYGKSYPKFIDKKHTGYSPPGLTIDFDPVHDLELKNYTTQSRVFDIENVNDGIIYIFFTDNQGRKIYSSCEIYYDEKDTLNICNQILSTFKFTN